ncbi:MAG: CotH kinase family protein, partial [Bacteroidia bacterium]|nr:CotH kinase family protein [Bacteroidia bacterium]
MRITHIILIIIGIGISNDFLAQTPDLMVEMQPTSGKYDSDVLVSLYAPKGAIYYTLNGNEPTRRSIRYRGPFKIRKTTVVRAAAYRYGQKSQVLSQTYLIKEPTSSIPIVSLSVPPHQLFNPEYGLFTEGENITSTHPAKYGANYWSRRKLTVNVEIFEINEDKVFNGKTEFRVFGGVSRTFPQKSFSVSLDKNYGVSEFKYPLFGKSGPKKIKHLVFRNSGSDWGKSHFRDAYITSLTRNLDYESQRYRPVHIYINGKYWGMYNMREKVNRYFLDTYYDIDRDSIDLLEGRYLIKSGYRTEYLKLLRYLRNNDLSSEEHYAYIKSKIDVESFTDFIITQIFVNNRDAGGNVKY